MTEEKKEYPSYNINTGVATEIETHIPITTYKYHPYGLQGFRDDVVAHVDEWQSKGFAWYGHDQLTHAWRTPWDTHVRYEELMSPLAMTVIGLINNHSGGVDKGWWLKECWISEYTNGSAANKHNHDVNSMGWSFCYYIKMPDEGPGFTVCDNVNSANHQLNVAEGDLLLFRHPLDHQVFPALDRRIIVSGNVVESNFVQEFYTRRYYSPTIIEDLDTEENDTNIDDWQNSIIDQKYNLKTQNGY